MLSCSLREGVSSGQFPIDRNQRKDCGLTFGEKPTAECICSREKDLNPRRQSGLKVDCRGMANADIALFLMIATLVIIAVLRTGIKNIKPHEEGVYIRRGRFVRILEPGLNIVAPVFNEVIIVDRTPQTHQIGPHVLFTEDGKEVVCKIRVSLRVRDTQKAFFEVTNYRSALLHVVSNSAQKFVSGMKHEDVLSSRGVIESKILESASTAANGFGVVVNAVNLQIQGAVTLTCGTCGASNPAFNSYCSCCGNRTVIEPADNPRRHEAVQRTDGRSIGPHRIKVAWSPDNLSAPYEVDRGFGVWRRKGRR